MKNRGMKRTVVYLAITYLILLVIGACIIRIDNGFHWLVTLFLFGPRWTIALPLLLLVPLTLAYRARLAWIYLLHVALIAFPILGLEVAWSRAQSSQAQSSRRGVTVRLMTCNLGGGSVRTDDLVNQARGQKAQVLMLQECSAAVATTVFEQLRWTHRQEGNIAIGSVFELTAPQVLARHPPSHSSAVAAVACELQLQTTDDTTGQSRTVATRLISVHLPTFRPALQAARRCNLSTGLEFRAVASRYRDLAAELREQVLRLDTPTIVAGDFNVPVESTFYRQFWSDFANAYDRAGIGLGYTKYTRYHGIRIDHVLASRHWRVDSASVGADLGGDHRPTMATLTLAE